MELVVLYFLSKHIFQYFIIFLIAITHGVIYCPIGNRAKSCFYSNNKMNIAGDFVRTK